MGIFTKFLIQPNEGKVGNDAWLTCSRVNLRTLFVIPTQLPSPLKLQMRNINKQHVYIITPSLENIGKSNTSLLRLYFGSGYIICCQ